MLCTQSVATVGHASVEVDAPMCFKRGIGVAGVQHSCTNAIGVNMSPRRHLLRSRTFPATMRANVADLSNLRPCTFVHHRSLFKSLNIFTICVFFLTASFNLWAA